MDSPRYKCDECPNCDCSYGEHQIVQGQSYVIQDAIRSTEATHIEPTTSREDRQKMPLPNHTSYQKWMVKFRREAKSQSPNIHQPRDQNK